MSVPELDKQCAAIKFDDVGVTRGGRTIWSHATFEVSAGGVVAVIGPNGSGKTTLLETILGLIPAASGQLRVFGRQPGGGDDIGYVPQDYAAGAGNAIRAVDAVTLGLTGHRWGVRRTAASQRREVLEALDAVDAQGFAHHRLSSLSGGQRQRVAIAEALVRSPRMLILDEPLASLDVPSQHEMIRLLARLDKDFGVTVVVVTHDLNSLLPILDSAIYLLRGRAHHAPVAELIDNALLTELYGTPMQVAVSRNGDRFIRSAL